jgi:hypothetical protein
MVLNLPTTTPHVSHEPHGPTLQLLQTINGLVCYNEGNGARRGEWEVVGGFQYPHGAIASKISREYSLWG